MTKISPRGDGYASRGVWQESRAKAVVGDVSVLDVLVASEDDSAGVWSW